MNDYERHTDSGWVIFRVSNSEIFGMIKSTLMLLGIAIFKANYFCAFLKIPRIDGFKLRIRILIDLECYLGNLENKV